MERVIEFVANHPFLIALWIAIALLLLWNLFSANLGGIKALAPTEAIRMLNHDDALLIDLRKKGEFDQGHILGARQIAAADIDQQIEKLKKDNDKPIILCCGNGMESQRTGRRLKQAGIEQVYLIKGGVPGWQQANLPLTRAA